MKEKEMPAPSKTLGRIGLVVCALIGSGGLIWQVNEANKIGWDKMFASPEQPAQVPAKAVETPKP